MNETKKIVNTKEVMVEMLEAGDKYFVKEEAWTVEGIDRFFEQYELPKMLRLQVRNLYLCLVADLSKCSKVTEQTVHNYIAAGLQMMRIDWERAFE